jgi:NhaP-type Na+/H+ and K+/H+ antiporter
MGILNLIRNNLIPPLQGLREGILEVADKAHLKVQKSKIMLAARDLENELKKQYSRLGKLAYQLKDSHDIDTLKYHPEAKSIYEVARDINAKKALLRKRLQALNDTGLDEQLLLLKRAMEEGKAKIVRITLAPGSPLKGRRLKEAKLPPNTLILCIMRKSRLIIPNGETRFSGNDNIFVLGLEPEVDNLDRFLNPHGA